eukprot:756618-Hanusia_phi.AAC.1
MSDGGGNGDDDDGDDDDGDDGDIKKILLFLADAPALFRGMSDRTKLLPPPPLRSFPFLASPPPLSPHCPRATPHSSSSPAASCQLE